MHTRLQRYPNTILLRKQTRHSTVSLFINNEPKSRTATIFTVDPKLAFFTHTFVGNETEYRTEPAGTPANHRVTVTYINNTLIY